MKSPQSPLDYRPRSIAAIKRNPLNTYIEFLGYLLGKKCIKGKYGQLDYE